MIKTSQEKLLDKQSASGTVSDVRGLQIQRSASGSVEEEAEEDDGSLSNEHVIADEDFDTDLELEDKEPQYDPTGRQSYLEACEKLGVVPASYFLRHMREIELSMEHRGLGPKGTKALAADVDVSDNRLGDVGAQAMASMLKENNTLTRLTLSNNGFTDLAAEFLSPALVSNSKLQHLDLSHNCFGDAAGRHLQEGLSENTGLRSLNLAWNCIRGKGAVMLANGLAGNIFLRSVDLSFNGFGKEGAVALGQALKENNVLEELNVSNNRIPPEGVIRLAMGLRANKTIKSLNVGRNPIQNAGCYGLLKSIQDNRDSAMEMLDLSDIFVNQDFMDLLKSMQDTFPALRVKHDCKFGHSVNKNTTV
ncbi:hypothetical protein WMY93_004740 [Mugilogobius chulae]|uniref:Leucine rich repeat containing 74B n=1 Tax=Mugilogobius chulae TaxID=88201 RepID=A0AAW0PXX2_9GOBI